MEYSNFWYLSLYFVAHLTVAAALEITVLRTKPVGNSGERFRMTARCFYRFPESIDKAEFTIELDKPTSKFKSKLVSVVSTDGDDYRVTNKRLIRKKFKVVFTVLYYGMEVPSGNCTDFEIITTTSSTTSSTTTTTAPMEPMPTELLENSDMESNFTDNWFCSGGCTLEQTNDSYTGSLAAKVTNRNRVWKGLSQNVNITAGTRYSLSGYIKLLNVEPGSMYHTVDLTMACTNNQGVKKYLKFGTDMMVQPEIWTEIGAVLMVPEGYNTDKVYFTVSGVTVDYIADSMSLHEVPELTDLEAKAMANINNFRKADITVRLTSLNALPSNLTIEIKQTRHEFPFGSCVGATEMVSTNATYQKYQEFFYEYFDWGTISNALKWKGMERVQGIINYDRPLDAINAMRNRGIRIRGHNMFWGVDRFVPDWVKNMSSADLLQAMAVRINGTVENTKGLLEHWDVNNENLHGDFYERQSGDPNITMQMFRDMYALDQATKLFLNDYGILKANGNQKATAIKTQAQLFQAAGVPIHGIGIQSHLKPNDVDITAMKARLDKAAEAGLPLWITELSVEEEDENVKAQALEEMLYLYFSHPAVEGIILWGFWDGRIWKDGMRLVEGPDLTPNAAGRVYMTLYKQTWRTQETFRIVDSSPINLRGFKGDYTVDVKQNNDTLISENFVLGSSGADVTINLP